MREQTWTNIQLVILHLEEEVSGLLSGLRDDTFLTRRYRHHSSRRRTFRRFRRIFCVALLQRFDEVDVGERLAFRRAVVWRHAVVQVGGEAAHDDLAVGRVLVSPTLKS